MRKNNKANFVFFDETDIGCQEKKKQNIPLNEDDLEQIAKEEYTVGLLKTFIFLEKKMSIDEFWGILEPKFKYIKNKLTWLRSDKWEGKLSVSLNKQYYLDLCQYYINANYDSKFIYFPDEAVEESKKLEAIEFLIGKPEEIPEHAKMSFYMKYNMRFADNLKNPLSFNRVMIESSIDSLMQHLYSFKETLLKDPKVTDDFKKAFGDVNVGIDRNIFYEASAVEFLSKSILEIEKMRFIDEVFYRQDLSDKLKEKSLKIRELADCVCERLSKLAIDITNVTCNFEVDHKRNEKTIMDLCIFSRDGGWYGTQAQMTKFYKALGDNKIIKFIISRYNEDKATLLNLKETLQERINYEKDN